MFDAIPLGSVDEGFATAGTAAHLVNAKYINEVPGKGVSAKKTTNI